MTALHQRIRRTIRRYGLCRPGARLLAGVSGGSDSVALTFLLIELSRSEGFAITSLAHFNHQLRPEAAGDEAFCRELARRADVPIAVESADVRGYAASQGLSIEEAARRLRYDFLERAADRVGADHIAVGHTQDDQAETFLLKLMRGAGLTGLGGIYPRRGRVIRPLLDVSRDDLRRYLQDRGEPWREDTTNADVSNPRNRIRHCILPELDRAYGGPTRPALARAASLAREDSQWLDELSARRSAELLTHMEDAVELDATLLAREPGPVRRRIVLDALRRLGGGRQVDLDHVQAAVDVLEGLRGAADVPGGRVELRRGKLVLYNQGDRPRGDRPK